MMEAMPVPALPRIALSAWVAGDRDRDLKALSVKRSPFARR